MSQRQQTDTSLSALATLSACITHANRAGSNCIMQAGGTAGSLSMSANLISASTGGVLQIAGSLSTPAGDPGTATWGGSCVMRWNITTANSNITWSELTWLAYSASAQFRLCCTYTTGLAISLGTTGVKTASVGVVAFAANTTDVMRLYMVCTNAAAMSAIVNYVYDQIVDVPFSASAEPATTAIPSLTLLNNGT